MIGRNTRHFIFRSDSYCNNFFADTIMNGHEATNACWIKWQQRFASRAIKLGGMKHRLYNLSGVVHPYVPSIYKKMIPSVFSWKGILCRKDMALNWWKKWASFVMTWRKLGGKQFIPWKFASTQALPIFKDLFTALHKQDWKIIHKNTTIEGERYFRDLIREQQIEPGEWKLEKIKSANAVHGVIVDAKQMKAFITQIIVQFDTVETFIPKDGNGNAITEEHQRILVFEKNVYDPFTQWKVVAELHPDQISNKTRPLVKVV
jgi:hypothetical protein